MAIYRHVYLSFWKDDKIMEQFSIEEKLLFIFFLTNGNTTQIGVYKILVKEIAFFTGISTTQVAMLMDKLENEYHMIKYNKNTHEIAIVHWAKYNMNKLGGKPIIDCISSELKRVEDVSLLKVILADITREEIKNLFLKEIKERENKKDNKKADMSKKGDGKKHGLGVYSKGKFASSVKGEDDSLYEKPSEEQLRKVKELYS